MLKSNITLNVKHSLMLIAKLFKFRWVSSSGHTSFLISKTCKLPVLLSFVKWWDQILWLWRWRWCCLWVFRITRSFETWCDGVIFLSCNLSLLVAFINTIKFFVIYLRILINLELDVKLSHRGHILRWYLKLVSRDIPTICLFWILYLIFNVFSN